MRTGVVCLCVMTGIYFFSSYTNNAAISGASSYTVDTSKAAEIIAEFEGFSETAYWDVNAFRAGFGSDTITLEDGQILSITEESIVTEEDAQRDLERRTEEFMRVVKGQTGRDIFLSLPENTQAALTSVAYNYGSLPETVVEAVKSENIAAIAQAVENLRSQDNGINAHRRDAEAKLIKEGF